TKSSTTSEISRRKFLGVTALGGATALLGPSALSISALTSYREARPKRGGTLRAGFGGGASSDTLDAQNPYTNVDFARVAQLYDPLVVFDATARPRLALAEEITANATATSWTIRVKADVTFHHGRSLSANDVIFSLRRILDPKRPLPGAPSIRLLDVKNAKTLDSRTVRIPCHRPFSTFSDVLPCYYFLIVPVDYNPRKPVGTGAFKYESFTPGVRSVFTRNNNYWQSGLPYVERQVITDYADEPSEVNALLSGQADIVDLLSAASIAAVRNGGAEALISRGGGFTPFTMLTNKAPFNDLRVREAMRLAIDRPQMLEAVFEGHGTIGNDVFGIW
ncbi:MAG: ABC transporter substrate-binding protein, partial [Candidatus Micrarchaeaceae archaeon]